MLFDNGNYMWARGQVWSLGAGNEIYVIKQFYDYKMTNKSYVVQHAHEIIHLSRTLQLFVTIQFCCRRYYCQASPLWSNFVRLLSIRDMSFPFRISLGLLIRKKRVEQNTHVLALVRERLKCPRGTYEELLAPQVQV